MGIFDTSNARSQMSFRPSMPGRLLMPLTINIAQMACLSISTYLLTSLVLPLPEAQARSRHRSQTTHSARGHSTGSSNRHHIRHHESSRRQSKTVAAKPRYAYPIGIFMARPPEFDQSPLSTDSSQRIQTAFENGTADSYPPSYLIRAGVMNFYSLRGGIFKRREPVKYIILHSTETGVPQDARHVIDAWSSLGRRHAGAQYVVDRDGTIYQSCDPELATVHVNIFKTLPGINNDNSVGIEMCHAGSQTYPPEQRQAVTHLMTYLQDRFHVLNENIVTHRYAQQGDHTDPVSFDFEAFLNNKDRFRDQALAMKHTSPVETIVENDLPAASVYLEMHRTLKPQEVLQRRPLSLRELQDNEQRINAYFMAQNLKTGGNMLPQTAAGNSFQESFNRSRGTALSNRAAATNGLRGELELSPDSASLYGDP